MSKKKRNIIIVLLILIFVIITIIISKILSNKIANNDAKNIENENLSGIIDVPYSETVIETSPDFIADRKFETLDIENVQLVESGGLIMFRADFTNNTEVPTSREDVKITLLDAAENTIDEIYGLLLSVQPKETTQLSIPSYNSESKNAKNFKIEKFEPTQDNNAEEKQEQ